MTCSDASGATYVKEESVDVYYVRREMRDLTDIDRDVRPTCTPACPHARHGHASAVAIALSATASRKPPPSPPPPPHPLSALLGHH